MSVRAARCVAQDYTVRWHGQLWAMPRAEVRTGLRGAHEEVPRWLRIANVKREYMRFIDVTTVHEGQLLPFRLALDFNWLNRYVEGRQARAARRRGGRELPG